MGVATGKEVVLCVGVGIELGAGVAAGLASGLVVAAEGPEEPELAANGFLLDKFAEDSDFRNLAAPDTGNGGGLKFLGGSLYPDASIRCLR